MFSSKVKYWRRILADYFATVKDNIDRKVEELPYQLKELRDGEALKECLLDWPIFRRLYREDYSYELMNLWYYCIKAINLENLCSNDYFFVADEYKKSLNILKDSGVPLTEYADCMKEVAKFLIQTGQYRNASNILEDRVKIEDEKLGERLNELADIYQAMAKCKSEVAKTHSMMIANIGYERERHKEIHESNKQFSMFPSHPKKLEIEIRMKKIEEVIKRINEVEEHKKVVEICYKSMEYSKKLQGDKHKYKLALVNILVCHHLSVVANLENKEELREEGLVYINEAISYFKEVDNAWHLAEALMSKSFAIEMTAENFHEKETLLLRARDLCLKSYGKNNLLNVQICFNMATLHDHFDETGESKEAYKYFRVCRTFSGWGSLLNHPLIENLHVTIDRINKTRKERKLKFESSTDNNTFEQEVIEEENAK